MKKTLIFILIMFTVLSFNPVLAEQNLKQDSQDRLFNFMENVGLKGSTDQPSEIVAEIIKILLSLLGVIFLVLMAYGGFMWMTARGNEDQVEKGKNIIIRATIGLVIILAAYSITYFITSWLVGSTTGGGTGIDATAIPAD